MITRKSKQDRLINLLNDATSPLLQEPNWAANMDLLDAVKNVTDPVRLSSMVNALRKKLMSRQHKIVMFTLALIETLMKNGHADLHLAFNKERFMSTMVKLVKVGKKGGTDAFERQEKCLELIQCWGQAFLTRQAIGKVFVTTYHNLRKKGIYKFPPQTLVNPIFDDDNNSPVVCSRSRKSYGGSNRSCRKITSTPNDKTIEEFIKEMEIDKDKLRKLLYHINPNETLSENDEINDLACKCAAHSDQLVIMIEDIQNDKNEPRWSERLSVLLELNDAMQSLTGKYEKLILAEVSMGDDESTAGYVKTNGNKSSLIGLVDNLDTTPQGNRGDEGKADEEDLLLLGGPLKENKWIAANPNPFHDFDTLSNIPMYKGNNTIQSGNKEHCPIVPVQQPSGFMQSVSFNPNNTETQQLHLQNFGPIMTNTETQRLHLQMGVSNTGSTLNTANDYNQQQWYNNAQHLQNQPNRHASFHNVVNGNTYQAQYLWKPSLNAANNNNIHQNNYQHPKQPNTPHGHNHNIEGQLVHHHHQPRPPPKQQHQHQHIFDGINQPQNSMIRQQDGLDQSQTCTKLDNPFAGLSLAHGTANENLFPGGNLNAVADIKPNSRASINVSAIGGQQQLMPRLQRPNPGPEMFQHIIYTSPEGPAPGPELMPGPPMPAPTRVTSTRQATNINPYTPTHTSNIVPSNASTSNVFDDLDPFNSTKISAQQHVVPVPQQVNTTTNPFDFLT